MPTGIYKRTEYHRKRISKGCRGHKHSKKTIKKIIESRKWYKHSEKTKQKIGLSHKGRQLSENQKKKMSLAKKGSKNWRWKGGQFIDKGYVYILKSNHPYCRKNGYILRSRLVMEKMIGHYLTPEEVVHHKGVHFSIGSVENRQDDSPENLQLFANHSKHRKYHWKLKL